MVPDWAERRGAPRTLAVEFPFGHPFGMPDDSAMQRMVAEAAVRLLAEADGPGTRHDLEIEWPVDRKTAYKDWQPAMPSPIVQVFLDRLAASRRGD